MNDSESTRHSLLARICDPRDDQAWAEFVELYSPFVYEYMRRRGLQPADAADVTQDVMRTVFRSVDRFQHSQRVGAFRKWLLTIARSRFCDFLSRSDPNAVGSGDTQILQQLGNQPALEDDQAKDEQEYRQYMFRQAAERVQSDVQDSSWQAFRLTYMEGQSCDAAAEHLGMSVEAVYMARSRVLARLRAKIREFEL